MMNFSVVANEHGSNTRETKGKFKTFTEALLYVAGDADLYEWEIRELDGYTVVDSGVK